MKKQISILVADENKDYVNKLKNTAESYEDIKLLDVAYNGEDVLKKITSLQPDVVISDVILSGLDGYAVIEEAKKKLCKARFIVVSSLASETFVQKAMNLGVEYYMIKPVGADLILTRVRDLFSLKSSANEAMENRSIEPAMFDNSKATKNKLLEEKITNIFITVGIPAHIKGYYFLREAIKMAIENPEVVNSITKKLYPSIAERFSTSASKVERAIRHAIEVAWNRGKIENINSVFGVKVYSNNEKPTNGEFIALVADKMLIEG